MLTHLRLRGFKSWKDTGDIALRPITGIFGANSSGKTSLIQALLLLKQTAESSDRNLTLHFGDRNTPTDLGNFLNVVHAHDPSGEIDISIEWVVDEPNPDQRSDSDDVSAGRSNSLAFRIRADQSGNEPDAAVSTVMMEYRVRDATFGMRRHPIGDKFEFVSDGSPILREHSNPSAVTLPRPFKYYGFPYQADWYFRSESFPSDLALALEECLHGVFHLGPLRARPERVYWWNGERPTDMGRTGELAVSAIVASRQGNERISLGDALQGRTIEEHVAYWLKELGLIHDFRVVRVTEDSPLYQVKVRRSSDGPETLITDVGFGVSQILPALVLCFCAPMGSTIILEQPEIHLHPAVQAGLADVLIDAHKRRGVQIIVESHSEHLLTRLQRRIAEEQLANDDLGLFFCEDRGSCSSITELQVDPYGNISNWPTDFFGDEFGEIAAMSLAGIERKLAAGE